MVADAPSFQAAKPCSTANASATRSKPATLHRPCSMAAGRGLPPVAAFSSGSAAKARARAAILHPADAREARARGIDGIILSNRGGRQLDGAVTPLRMIGAIRGALGDLPLMVDSGFRRGTDVLKAMALGADFVFVGRPFNYAAALAGQAGVAHAIGILAREIDSAMGLLGLNSLEELGPDQLVVPADFPVLPP